MSKSELSMKLDRIEAVMYQAYEMLNNTGDYESDQLDKATCMAQDILEILQYVQKYDLNKD